MEGFVELNGPVFFDVRLIQNLEIIDEHQTRIRLKMDNQHLSVVVRLSLEEIQSRITEAKPN